MLKATVQNTEGKEIDTISLDESIFNDKILSSSVYQVINAYRAAQRAGLASTKTRGEVSGGGKKPWKQKGTGRARVGSTRSPLWRHGGVVFGPHPRDFSFSVPKKIKDNALRFVLTEKAKAEDMIVLDGISFAAPKTKEAAALLKNLKLSRVPRILILVAKMDDTLKRVFGNIENIALKTASGVTTYELLVANKVIITKDGLADLSKRLATA